MKNGNVTPCFVQGTVLLTGEGEVLVEDIKPGQRVITYDRGMQKVRWVGWRRFSSYDLTFNSVHLRPILIPAGSLGFERPSRDLRVSPHHRIHFKANEARKLFNTPEVLVSAKDLIGFRGIDYGMVSGGVIYYHIMFDRHELVFSDGLVSESFYPGEESISALNAETMKELLEIFPELSREVALLGEPCRRILKPDEASQFTHVLSREVGGDDNVLHFNRAAH